MICVTPEDFLQNIPCTVITDTLYSLHQNEPKPTATII
ncbi:hypothetical protein VPHK460_0130 [Vibrio phage K460]